MIVFKSKDLSTYSTGPLLDSLIALVQVEGVAMEGERMIARELPLTKVEESLEITKSPKKLSHQAPATSSSLEIFQQKY